VVICQRKSGWPAKVSTAPSRPICMDVSAPAASTSTVRSELWCNSSRQRRTAEPNRLRCIAQYTDVELKVASYGTGICQNHRATKNAAALLHRPLVRVRCAAGGQAKAIIG